MKKDILIITLLILAILPSCKKDEKSEPAPSQPQEAANTKFIGTYTLSIDYIFVGDEGEAPSSGAWTGTMEITANGDNNVVVTSQIEIKDGAFLPLYNTTGTVNEAGELVLAPNNYDNGSYVFNLSYTPFKYAEPLRFESEMFVDIQGYATTYTITNVARKKQ